MVDKVTGNIADTLDWAHALEKRVTNGTKTTICQSAGAGEGVEVIGTGQAGACGHAVDLEEVAPGPAVFQDAQGGHAGK